MSVLVLVLMLVAVILLALATLGGRISLLAGGLCAWALAALVPMLAKL